MSIFAIGDLHLPGHAQKPMDVFGSHWDRHFETISDHWRHMVAPADVVLIPGDISWAMQLDQALDDLRAIAALPGRKLLLRGNHDYWWSSLSKLRAALAGGDVRHAERRARAGWACVLRNAWMDVSNRAAASWASRMKRCFAGS